MKVVHVKILFARESLVGINYIERKYVVYPYFGGIDEANECKIIIYFSGCLYHALHFQYMIH